MFQHATGKHERSFYTEMIQLQNISSLIIPELINEIIGSSYMWPSVNLKDD